MTIEGRHLRGRWAAAACAGLFLALLFLPCPARAEVLSVKEYGYSLDLPEGWIPFDASDMAKLSFTDPASGAMLQISIFAHERSITAQQMENDLRKQLKGEGSGTVFSFSGRDCYLSDVTFTSAGNPFRGFILVVRALDRGGISPPTLDGILIAFAPIERYEKARDDLLSALDSFSPDQAAKLLPGPISQLSDAYPDDDRKTLAIQFLGETLPVTVGKGEQESEQALVEREARLLASYKAGQIPAWQRFYRMIFRDGYHRLDGILAGLKREMEARGVAPQDTPTTLLCWIQGFTFQRTGTLSDFLSPIAVAASEAGDCDSRALLYAALLDQLGYDAMIFVSPRYGHALAGVKLDRQGATISFADKRYIVAEMTEPVDIGLIAKDMADPTAWIGMPLKN